MIVEIVKCCFIMVSGFGCCSKIMISIRFVVVVKVIVVIKVFLRC